MLTVYYISMVIISVALTIVLVLKWRKRFDVSFALVFLMVNISNMGYLATHTSGNLEEALLSQKIIYLGGCFLPLFIFFAVIRLCRFHVPQWVRAVMVAISVIFYGGVMTIGFFPFFYRSAIFKMTDGTPALIKEYTMVHTLFNVVIFLYFLAGIGVLIHTYLKRIDVSRKILKLLLVPFLLCVIGFWLDKSSLFGLQVLPLLYDIALVIYLIIIKEISMYDIIDMGIDALAREGDTGFISLDTDLDYLGSNEVAKNIIPDIKRVAIDTCIRDYRLFDDNLIKWLNEFLAAESEGKKRDQFTCKSADGNRVYYVNVSNLFDGRKKRGYQFFFVDYTKDYNYNVRLEKEVKQKTAHIVEMHNALIMGMATMVESRDNSTGGHIRRTSELVRILIEKIRRYSNGEFDITDEFCEAIIKAAPMHDLGKIAVDDEILRKPGRFEPWEFEKMKEHAHEGARIVHEVLKGTDDDYFREIAQNVAHFHHERWDGSGYPDKLSGEQIPLEARIMAIADVYDALVSKRVYKEKMSFEQADSIIREGMGSQFDARLEPYYNKARPEFEHYYTEIENDVTEKEDMIHPICNHRTTLTRKENLHENL